MKNITILFIAGVLAVGFLGGCKSDEGETSGGTVDIKLPRKAKAPDTKTGDMKAGDTKTPPKPGTPGTGTPPPNTPPEKKAP